MARLFEATQSWFDFNERDVWTLFHSLAFDFSVWELWGALLYGGRLVVVPYWVSRTPEAFLDLLFTERVTVLNQTPAAFRQLIRVEGESPDRARELSLRLVIFGGEALELKILEPWFDRYGDQKPRLVNMYGITETTVHVTYRPVTMVDLSKTSGSVIGCPIPDFQVYVLDQNLQPVPLGIPGEMHVGGAGVARGYLDRSELSAERFIPDPLSKKPGTRLYRTGDLARRLADGDIEYLGRIDHQVKIRGYRVELGEIEAMLRQHPAVRETVVVARDDVPHGKHLVAYVVAVQAPTPSVTELRGFLKAKLPDYMLPAAFVLLEAFPLTPNGKVDRRALPEPDQARSELEESFLAPRNPVEEVLAGIWAEVLGVAQVGVHDNFFELGGHSLLATRVISRMREAFQVEVPLRALFEAPTVAGLAVKITQSQTGKAEPEEMARVLSELEALSDKQAKRLLAKDMEEKES